MPTWIRVRDRVTGHEYDLAPSAINDAAHEVLNDYPPNEGETAVPRPPKHRTSKAGTTGRKSAGKPAQTEE